MGYYVLPWLLNTLLTLILPWVPENVSVQIIERAVTRRPFISACLEVKIVLLSGRE